MNCLFPGKFISFSRNNFRYSRFFQVFGFSSLFSRFSRYLLHIPGFSRFSRIFQALATLLYVRCGNKKIKKQQQKTTSHDHKKRCGQVGLAPKKWQKWNPREKIRQIHVVFFISNTFISNSTKIG